MLKRFLNVGKNDSPALVSLCDDTAELVLRKPVVCGAPGEIRTPDLRIRSPTLYPAELQAQKRFPHILRTLIVFKFFFL